MEQGKLADGLDEVVECDMTIFILRTNINYCAAKLVVSVFHSVEPGIADTIYGGNSTTIKLHVVLLYIL